MNASVLFWRRTDVEGLERLELAIEPDAVTATSLVICLEAGGFRLEHLSLPQTEKQLVEHRRIGDACWR